MQRGQKMNVHLGEMFIRVSDSPWNFPSPRRHLNTRDSDETKNKGRCLDTERTKRSVLRWMSTSCSPSFVGM